MKLALYQVDAFTDRLFHGNPACVVPLDNWLPDQLLLEIAKENAVAETAFFIRQEDHFHLRWFTPEFEMDLCGHATLAAAHVIKTNGDHPKDPIIFHSRSGVLEVSVHKELYTLNFPSRRPEPAELPVILISAIDRPPVEVLKDCSLIPYWSDRLGKKQMTAFQLSERIGKLFCEDRGDRVLISGNARTYSTGTLDTE